MTPVAARAPEESSLLRRMKVGPKSACLGLVAIGMLALSSPVPALVVGILVTGLALLAGLGEERSFQDVLPILLVSSLLGLFHLVADRGEDLFLRHPFPVSRLGVCNAITYSSRLWTVSLVSLSFAWTTSLSEVAWMLRRIGLSSQLSLAVTLAIRFVPLVEEEVRDARIALKLKGCARLKRPIVVFRRIWLLLSSVSVRTLCLAQNAAIALDSRGFRAHSSRTLLRSARPAKWEWAVVGSIAMLIAVLKLLELRGWGSWWPFAG